DWQQEKQWEGTDMSSSNHNYSRRAFLVQAGAAAALPILGSKGMAQQEPKRGGQFRLGLAGSVEQTLDPGVVTDAVNQNINYQTHNTLVEILPDMSAGPELAESWEASPDARIWVFKLVKGVTFHNGK